MKDEPKLVAVNPLLAENSALRLQIAELRKKLVAYEYLDTTVLTKLRNEARGWFWIAQASDRRLNELATKYVFRIRRARAELRVHRSPEMTDLERIHLRCKDLLDEIPEM